MRCSKGQLTLVFVGRSGAKIHHAALRVNPSPMHSRMRVGQRHVYLIGSRVWVWRRSLHFNFRHLVHAHHIAQIQAHHRRVDQVAPLAFVELGPRAPLGRFAGEGKDEIVGATCAVGHHRIPRVGREGQRLFKRQVDHVALANPVEVFSRHVYLFGFGQKAGDEPIFKAEFIHPGLQRLAHTA